jgi:hypothetical protein
MTTLFDFFPDPQVLLNLEPEELAGFVIEYLHSLSPNDRSQRLMRDNLQVLFSFTVIKTRPHIRSYNLRNERK